MSAEKHTRNMLLRTLALLWERMPAPELRRQLQRFGFDPDDVAFRYPTGRGARRRATKQGRALRARCEVKRWPWERTKDEAARVAQGRAESETQE